MPSSEHEKEEGGYVPAVKWAQSALRSIAMDECIAGGTCSLDTSRRSLPPHWVGLAVLPSQSNRQGGIDASRCERARRNAAVVDTVRHLGCGRTDRRARLVRWRLDCGALLWTRRPLPRSVICCVGLDLAVRDFWQMAVCWLLMVGCYLRPSECISLMAVQIIPRQAVKRLW